MGRSGYERDMIQWNVIYKCQYGKIMKYERNIMTCEWNMNGLTSGSQAWQWDIPELNDVHG